MSNNNPYFFAELFCVVVCKISSYDNNIEYGEIFRSQDSNLHKMIQQKMYWLLLDIILCHYHNFDLAN